MKIKISRKMKLKKTIFINGFVILLGIRKLINKIFDKILKEMVKNANGK